MSLDMVFPQDLQSVSGSSDHISFLEVQKAHTSSSGNGVLISLLPGHVSFMILFYLIVVELNMSLIILR